MSATDPRACAGGAILLVVVSIAACFCPARRADTPLTPFFTFIIHLALIEFSLKKEEIAEVLLQVAIYGGVPGALESFRTAQAVFDEMSE